MTTATVVIAALAVVVFWKSAAVATRNRVLGAFVVLPLVANIPWVKQWPAITDALTLLVSAAALWAWLYARQEGIRKRRRAYFLAAACVLVMPEALLLPLAAVAIEGWRQKRTLPLTTTVRACALLAAVAALSYLVIHPLAPPAALAGFWEKLKYGAAWDGRFWIFSGTDSLDVYRLSSTYGAYVWWPLLPAFLALGWRSRRESWFTPLWSWGAIVSVLTLGLVAEPVFPSCPPLQAAMLLPFGAAAVARLETEFPAFFRHFTRSRGAGDASEAQ